MSQTASTLIRAVAAAFSKYARDSYLTLKSSPRLPWHCHWLQSNKGLLKLRNCNVFKYLMVISYTETQNIQQRQVSRLLLSAQALKTCPFCSRSKPTKCVSLKLVLFIWFSSPLAWVVPFPAQLCSICNYWFNRRLKKWHSFFPRDPAAMPLDPFWVSRLLSLVEAN